MAAILGSVCVVVLLGMGQGQALPPADPDLWTRVELLLKDRSPQGNAKIVEYLKSLSADKMLETARQGAHAGAAKPRLTLDVDRAAAAESNAMEPLQYYFEKVEVDQGAKTLLIIVADKTEHPWFRRAIVGRMSGGAGRSRFIHAFQEYVCSHTDEVEPMLVQIVGDQTADGWLRAEAIHAMASLLGRQVRAVWDADPNVRIAIQEERKHTTQGITETALIRSGKATLTQHTLIALKPIEARILAHARLLANIVGDEDNEPRHLRQKAKRTLRGYGTLPVAGKDEIAKLLPRP